MMKYFCKSSPQMGSETKEEGTGGAKMSGTCIVNTVLQHLEERNEASRKNQELNRELGLKEERLRQLEEIVTSVKVELDDRDILIRKVLQKNEVLEKRLRERDSSDSLRKKSHPHATCDNDRLLLLMQLRGCHNAIKLLETTCEETLQCVKDKDEYIANLVDQHTRMTSKMPNQLKAAEEHVDKLKKLLGKSQREVVFYKKKYEKALKLLEERTTEVCEMNSQLENHERTVSEIKRYINNRKHDSTSLHPSRGKTRPSLLAKSQKPQRRARNTTWPNQRILKINPTEGHASPEGLFKRTTDFRSKHNMNTTFGQPEMDITRQSARFNCTSRQTSPYVTNEQTTLKHHNSMLGPPLTKYVLKADVPSKPRNSHVTSKNRIQKTTKIPRNVSLSSQELSVIFPVCTPERRPY